MAQDLTHRRVSLLAVNALCPSFPDLKDDGRPRHHPPLLGGWGSTFCIHHSEEKQLTGVFLQPAEAQSIVPELGRSFCDNFQSTAETLGATPGEDQSRSKKLR